MRPLIVATAGHIDHGKSALVLALTGTDPDRLKEEKERGITTDLGFAHAELEGGAWVSFVDVPGHERFVRHMVAGAHGVDAALLVVAADESVMPQTREHFEICRLLGVQAGLVALTKCDAATAEQQARAEAEVRGLVAGSFLAGAPPIRVSARTGAGLDTLREALRGLAAAQGVRADAGLLRLPLDRVFTLRGFGTVVTGTLRSGELRVGDEVEVLPAGHRARVRGLEVHGVSRDRVTAGHRTAVNLSGVEVAQLARGDTLARPGTLRATSMLDVEIALLATAPPLPEGTRIRVHVASAEVLARVKFLGRESLKPGERAVAQLRLESPVVAGLGDRLVLRSPSPASTIGGARVLNPLPPKRRSADRARLEALAGLAADDAAGAARIFVEEAGVAGVSLATLAARLTLPRGSIEARLRDAPGIVRAGESAWAEGALATLRSKALSALAAFHRAEPLRESMPLEALRRATCGRAEGAWEPVLAGLLSAGAVRRAGDGVAAPDHRVTLDPAEAETRERLLAAAAAAGFEGFELKGLEVRADERLRTDRVLRALLAARELRQLPEGRILDGARLDRLVKEVRERWPPGTRLDVADFKAMTGLTRKFAIPLLEYLDRERVMRRVGAERFVQ